MKRISTLALPLALSLAVSACGGSSSGASGAMPAVPGTTDAATAATEGVASFALASNVSRAALPLDDHNYTTSGPKAGWIYSCSGTFNGGGSQVVGPWIDTAAGTWNSLIKPAVEGAVRWHSVLTDAVGGATRSLAGNGLPSHTTGKYPISASDPVYAYDMNPNSIASQTLEYAIPANPAVAASPTCVGLGPIGIMLTGAQLYNALDAGGRDAPAHEVLDACAGHPDQSGTYHYHSLSPCMKDPGHGHSALLGYALDGFGIYGVRGPGGKTMTDATLDACHGHTHAIVWNGKTVRMYHYHLTYEYPYSVGCFRGTPVRTGPPGGP